MNNQYCKIGSVTPITSDNVAVANLERRYHHFLEKVTNAPAMDARLHDFFEGKAKSFRKILETLV